MDNFMPDAVPIFTTEKSGGTDLVIGKNRSILEEKAGWLEGVIVERAWISVTYEEGYSKAYDSITEARRGLKAYFESCDYRRLHQILDIKTPYEVYWGSLPKQRAAA
jgi:putative transposase